MIYLYSGTPGSGKSLHALKDICFKLKHNGNVIANFPIKIENLGKLKGEFIFKNDDDLTVDFLTNYAYKNHIKGKEGQTLLVIDEAQGLFNPREYTRADRKLYNKFFSLHRHLGFNVILITQNDRLLDRQIRCLIEYDVKHRNINNYIFIGKLFPIKVFACITYWYGVREKIQVEFFSYRKKLGNLYDSYALFDVMKKNNTEVDAGLGDGRGSPVLHNDKFYFFSSLKKTYLSLKNYLCNFFKK